MSLISECNKCINEKRLNRLIDAIGVAFCLLYFLVFELLVGLSFQPKVAKFKKYFYLSNLIHIVILLFQPIKIVEKELCGILSKVQDISLVIKSPTELKMQPTIHLLNKGGYGGG
jgi:hypothetical protein